jgi:hypothetical protein
MRSAKVVGVHPVEADQRCHLIELTICDPNGEFNVNGLTRVDETSRDVGGKLLATRDIATRGAFSATATPSSDD